MWKSAITYAYGDRYFYVPITFKYVINTYKFGFEYIFRVELFHIFFYFYNL